MASGVSWILYFGSPDGTPDGCPVYSADVPFAVIPLTGQPDTLSLSFSGAQSILFDSFFLLHRTFGNATLEYFIKPPICRAPRSSGRGQRRFPTKTASTFSFFRVVERFRATIGSRTAPFTDLWAEALKW